MTTYYVETIYNIEEIPTQAELGALSSELAASGMAEWVPSTEIVAGGLHVKRQCHNREVAAQWADTVRGYYMARPELTFFVSSEVVEE